jgi:hypothetical protein
MKGSTVSSLGSLGDRTIRIKLEFLDLIFYPLIIIRDCFSDRLRVAADAQSGAIDCSWVSLHPIINRQELDGVQSNLQREGRSR